MTLARRDSSASPGPAPGRSGVSSVSGSLQTIGWVAVILLAAVALLTALYFSRALVLPILAAILIHFTFVPLVQGLARLGLPTAAGAAVVVGALIATVVTGLFLLRDPALRWARELPNSLQVIERKLVTVKESVQEVSRATEQMEKIAAVDEEEPVVKVKSPGLQETLVSGLGETAGGMLVTLILLFFLLRREDSVLRKVMSIAPRIADKKMAVRTHRAVQRQVSRYLLTITSINACLAVAVGVAMWLTGLPNPVLWGVVAGLLNFVPYLGAVCGILVVGVVGMLTFESWTAALTPAFCYALLTGLEGMVVTPIVLGHRLRLSPAILFAWLLLWGWLWGVPGALIAVPLLVSVKITCDNVTPLAAVGRFLGRA